MNSRSGGYKKYIPKNMCGLRIRRFRDEQKLPLIELSGRLEDYSIYISRWDLGRIENGERFLRDFELVALAKVLNIDVTELLTGEGSLSIEEFAEQNRGKDKDNVA